MPEIIKKKVPPKSPKRHNRTRDNLRYQLLIYLSFHKDGVLQNNILTALITSREELHDNILPNLRKQGLISIKNLPSKVLFKITNDGTKLANMLSEEIQADTPFARLIELNKDDLERLSRIR